MRRDLQTTAMADPDFPVPFDRLELSVRGSSSFLRFDLHLVPPSVLMVLPSVMTVAPLQAILRYSTLFYYLLIRDYLFKNLHSFILILLDFQL